MAEPKKAHSWEYFEASTYWGFDEYMNLVLDDADEVNVKKNTRKPLGENDFRS
ncbi:hypothetical protein KSP39_PZI022258 [Platanthera zijinensis]|uniref:Sm protein E n=1 Tax=Platanthera zijinensis TaxID=2320716 RepID=A0AAP0AW04_9ASPA